MTSGESTIGILFRIKAETDDANKKIDETGDKTDRLANLFSKLAGSDVSEKLSGLTLIAGGVAAGIGAVAGAAVAGGTALFALAEKASEAGSEIYDASQKTGLGAETLSSLKYAADEAGSSLEAISGGVTKFSKLVAEAAEGSKEAKKKIEAFGLDPQKAIDDLDGSLAKVFERIAKVENPIVATKMATDAFGKSGADLIPVIKSFDGDMAGLIARAKELGVVLTDEDAAAADEFGDTLDDLKKQAGGAATQFSLGFMPAVTTAMREISGAAADNKKVWREWGEDVGYVLLRFVRGVRVAAAAAKDLFSGNYSATNTLIALQQNAEAYDNDRRQKEIKDNLNDPNRPEWLKQQDKDAGKFGNNDSEKYLSAAGSDKKEKDPTKNWSLTKVLEAMRKGTMGQESSGDKFARNSRTGAMGLFQVTPKNVKNWTRETFEYEMSPEEFKKDAQAQITIFNKYMGAYLQKGLEMSKGDWNKAIRIAAVQWYGTSKKEGLGYDDPKVFQKGEPSRREYTNSVLKRTRKFLIGKDSDFDFDEAEKQAQIAERLRAEAVKNREEQDRQILEINRRTAAEDKAILTKNLAEKLISEKEYSEKVATIDAVNLQTEKTILEQRLTMTELSAEERAKIEEEIARVTSEIKVKNTETETEYIKAQNEELEKQKEIDEKIAQLRAQTAQSERERLNFLAAQERKILVNNLESAKNKKDLEAAQIVLYEFDRKEAELQKQRLLDQLQDEEDAEKRSISLKEKSEEAKLEIENRYKNLRLNVQDEYQEKINEIEEGFLKKAEENSAFGFGGFDVFVSSFVQGISKYLEGVVLLEDANGRLQFSFDQAFSSIAQLGLQAFSSLAQGFGQMVANWVLYGDQGGSSLRKMTAQILANVAQTAATYAIMCLAAAALATTVFGAALLGGTPAQFLAAAALFGAVAVGTALVGRAVAGDSFKQANNQSASNQAQINSGGSGGSRSGNGGSAYSSSGNERTIVEEDRLRRESVQRHEHVLKLDRGLMVETISSNIRDRGELHGLIIETADS